MENLLEIKNDYNSLDKLKGFLEKESIYKCSKEYDTWDLRTNADGQLEQCLIFQKSGMHAIKLHFTNDNTVKANYIIPNKVMHAYFGKSVKARRNIIEIIAGTIKQAVLAGPQQKAFEELAHVVRKAAI